MVVASLVFSGGDPESIAGCVEQFGEALYKALD
jgi:hypothetical protein